MGTPTLDYVKNLCSGSSVEMDCTGSALPRPTEPVLPTSAKSSIITSTERCALPMPPRLACPFDERCDGDERVMSERAFLDGTAALAQGALGSAIQLFSAIGSPDCVVVLCCSRAVGFGTPPLIGEKGFRIEVSLANIIYS